MVSFYNFNDVIRELLNNTYIILSDKFKKDKNIKLYEIIENIKLENYDFYKTIIGLSFLDSYRLLTDKKNYNNLTANELEFLNLFEKVEDIDDLMFLLEENPNVINSILLGSIKFKRLNLKGQANMLLQLPDDKSYKFNKFYFFEKYEMFKDRSKDDIINIYLKKDKLKKEEKIYEILNIMDVMFIGNINGFSKLLLEMLKVFYKWKKVLQITKPELTFGLEDEILEIVENNSIENIIYLLTCSPNLIEIIITDFLEYETNDMILKSEIEKLYETLVSREIKIKLKEV
mgnify:CR=1 FL=1